MSVITRYWWENTETWTTREGEVIALEDLEPSHRRNILRWTARRIERVREVEGWRWAIQVALHDGGDMAHDAIESEAAFVDESSPVEFFNSLPLVKALKALEPKVIVRVASHRANDALRRIVPIIERQELYSWDLAGTFVEIPAYLSAEVLALKGITRARKQDRSLYSKTWSSDRLTPSAKREILQCFGNLA